MRQSPHNNMSNKKNTEMLPAKYAEQIENYVNNWSTETIESQKELRIEDVEHNELIVIENEYNYGQDSTKLFHFYVRNEITGGGIWFEKDEDLQEVYRKVRIIMDECNKRVNAMLE